MEPKEYENMINERAIYAANCMCYVFQNRPQYFAHISEVWRTQAQFFFLKSQEEHWQKYLESSIPSHLVFVDFIFRHPAWPNSYLLTYLLTPLCRVLLEQLTGLQLVKKFPAFHGTRRFITALTSVGQMSLSWDSPIQSISPHPTSWRSILILPTHLRLGLPSGILPPGFPARHQLYKNKSRTAGLRLHGTHSVSPRLPFHRPRKWLPTVMVKYIYIYKV